MVFLEQGPGLTTANPWGTRLSTEKIDNSICEFTAVRLIWEQTQLVADVVWLGGGVESLEEA
jgi:hypothetical protein